MNESWDSLFLTMTSCPINVTSVSMTMRFEVIQAEQYVVINEILASITVVIALSGVFVNTLNIKTFIMIGLDDGVTVSFLALSLSDLSYTFIQSIKNIASLCSSVENRFGLWFTIDPFAVRFFSANVGVAIYMVTTLTTAFLAVMRCMCVARPLHFKNMFTRLRCTVLLLFFALFSIASQAPVFAHMGMVVKFDAQKNATRLVLWMSEERERVKDIVRLISNSLLPISSELVIVFCVIVMAHKLRESVRFRRMQELEIQGSSEKDKPGLTGKELTVVFQVVMISVIFIVCTIPKNFAALFTLSNPKFDMGKPYHYLYILIHGATTTFDCINSSVNFYVYLYFNPKFRLHCFSFTGK